jgi:hypothetical protein
MFTTAAFFNYACWAGLATLGLAAIAILSFVLQWGLRFRLVGATGFLGVLTGGLFALSLVPLTHTVVPGAARFSLVYDTGAAQTVIAVSPEITQPELEATLLQAANDLFSPGRLGVGQNVLTIKARTILHPQPGASEPLLLGQVQRSLAVRDDPNLEITLYTENLARLPQASGQALPG